MSVIEAARCVMMLAQEIQHPSANFGDPREFRAHWVKALASRVGKLGAWEHRSRYPEKIGDWCDQIEAAATDDIPALLKSIREQISAIDYDDGWATDASGSVLEALCLSLMPGTRWMAEAGARVWTFATGSTCFNEVSHFSRKAWLRQVFADCLPLGASAAQAAAGAHSDEAAK